MGDLNETFGLAGRVAVVTGAASGIGRAVAEILAEAGAKVVLGDLDAEGAEGVAKSIRERGEAAVAQGCNVGSREEVDALVDRAASEFGGLDVLCNVAGVPADGLVESLTDEEVDRVFAINLKGTLYGCQAAIPRMAARGASRRRRGTPRATARACAPTRRRGPRRDPRHRVLNRVHARLPFTAAFQLFSQSAARCSSH